MAEGAAPAGIPGNDVDYAALRPGVEVPILPSCPLLVRLLRPGGTRWSEKAAGKGTQVPLVENWPGVWKGGALGGAGTVSAPALPAVTAYVIQGWSCPFPSLATSSFGQSLVRHDTGLVITQ